MHTLIKRVIGLLVVGLLSSAQAASFDCDKASAEVEKMICADQILSDLDNMLAGVYNEAIFRAANPADFKVTQLSWLKDMRNVCLTAECLELAYRQRIMDLEAIPVIYASLNEAIDGTCREMAALASDEEPGMCQLIDSSSFGALGDASFHYARYCLGWMSPDTKDKQCSVTGIALFEENKTKGMTEVFHQNAVDSDSYLEAPFLTKNDYGVVLTAPVLITGTGAFNDNHYFIRRKNRWVGMDTERWLIDFNRRTPSDLYILKGVDLNLSSMNARANLYQNGDPNCCPSGGAVDVDLGIAGNLLFIKDIYLEPPKAEDNADDKNESA